MSKSPKSIARTGVNSLLGAFNLKLVRRKAYYADYRDYIPLQEMVEGARQAGLSVGDYIDTRHNVPGATQNTIDQMAALGAFDTQIDRVCEIGPGSGRYLEKIVQAYNPTYYEIYETADEWANWLIEKYSVVRQPADGTTLAATPSASIDLVHNHKVLPGQPSLVILRYFLEMMRVVRKGGKIAFDIVTEDCMGDEILDAWLISGAGYQHYPCLVPKQFTIDFFRSRGFSFDGDFLISMKPGMTHYFVFTKNESA